jgi:hypothetical protein
VELGDKVWSTLAGTIHQRPENLQVGILFLQNWLSKTPYDICRSCRGIRDIQLSLLPLGSLL